MNCPKPEFLLELISIPGELGAWRKLSLKAHLWRCADCQKQRTSMLKAWNRFLVPEPDITSSLLSVYSRLQRDETLILKGWKIGQGKSRHSATNPILSFFLNQGWIFRGAVGFAAAAVVAVVLVTQNLNRPSPPIQMARKTPLAQIRMEAKNGVRVHYLQPELLQSVEFETTSGR